MSATLPFPPQSPALSPALSPAQVSLSTSPAPLLDLLPPEERVRLSPLLTRVLLANADVLYWRNQRIEHVYFPIDAVGSLIAQSEDGEIVEAGLVGREGVVGLPLFLGRESGPQQAVCQVPGEAWRMHAADFCRTVAQPSALHGLLLKYTQTLLVLTSQGVLCNRLHPLDRRLARWLLLIHDRVGRDSFALTHEYIAVMLGVRRAGVTVALSALRDAGVIEYHRGKMTVTDRPGLEAATCQCYRVCVEQIDRRPRGALPAHTFNA